MGPPPSAVFKQGQPPVNIPVDLVERLVRIAASEVAPPPSEDAIQRRDELPHVLDSAPASVKVVNGPRAELLATNLDEFSREQCLRFAIDCRARLFKYHEHAEGREFWERFRTSIGVT